MADNKHNWLTCPLRLLMDEREKQGVKRDASLSGQIEKIDDFLRNGFTAAIKKEVVAMANAVIVRGILWFGGAAVVNVGLTLLVIVLTRGKKVTP